jgi:hypothetical protein
VFAAPGDARARLYARSHFLEARPIRVEIGPSNDYRLKARHLWRAEQHGGTMSLQARIESLKERHASLETQIADEDHRPRPDDGTLCRLKLQKLRLKEEMERLRSH